MRAFDLQILDQITPRNSHGGNDKPNSWKLNSCVLLNTKFQFKNILQPKDFGNC